MKNTDVKKSLGLILEESFMVLTLPKKISNKRKNKEFSELEICKN